MNKFIITPTYNEKENLPVLIEKIRQHAPEWNILVVDDNSPDGTGELADKIAQKDSRVTVLHRPGKNGFGTAYQDGVHYIFKRFPETEIICWMDADLSHNPLYLSGLEAMLDSCDVVIGSRYVQGGGVENWPWHRRFLSRGGNWYARTISGLNVKDCTAGYIVFKTPVLRSLDFNGFHAQGYSFLIETKATCQKKGYILGEHPIIFQERREGKSKLSKKIIMEALLTVWKIRFKK